MPGYGLPEGNKGLLSWSWAERRLKKSHNYWITTVKLDGSPHTMVVWGLWQDGCFLFSTGSKSRKARNLAQNSNCVVCTENAGEAVIIEGVARFVTDTPTLQRVVDLMNAKYQNGADLNFLNPARNATINGAFGNCTIGKSLGQPSWVRRLNPRRNPRGLKRRGSWRATSSCRWETARSRHGRPVAGRPAGARRRRGRGRSGRCASG